MRKLDFMKFVMPGLLWLGISIQNCAPPPLIDVSVGGRITGLTGTLTLLNPTSDDDLVITTRSFYRFIVGEAFPYDISILEQPEGQTCTFVNDNNEGVTSNVQIDDIDIVCTDNTSNKIIFITAATHNGDFDGISGTDAFCMTDANRPNSSDYKALIAGSAIRVACGTPNCSMGALGQTDWVLAPDTTYVRLDGTTTIGTTNSDGIFDFPLDNSFAGATGFFWSGLNGDWTTAINDCLDGITVDPWGTSSGGASGELGSTHEVSDEAISNGSDTCNTFKALACVEQ